TNLEESLAPLLNALFQLLGDGRLIARVYGSQGLRDRLWRKGLAHIARRDRDRRREPLTSPTGAQRLQLGEVDAEIIIDGNPSVLRRIPGGDDLVATIAIDVTDREIIHARVAPP